MDNYASDSTSTLYFLLVFFTIQRYHDRTASVVGVANLAILFDILQNISRMAAPTYERFRRWVRRDV